MSTAVNYLRKYALGLLMMLSSLQSITVSPIVTGVVKWQSTWVTNRAQIMTLTAVNTTITTVNEMLSRSVSTKFSDPSKGFLVRNQSGGLSIHRQSLINIWMTFFASLFGGVIFFIKSRYQRFLFFIIFGLFNSVISQFLGGLIRDGFVLITLQRLYFDLGYMATFKFLIFEFGRKPIVESGKKIINLGVIRGGQDFVTTFLKVSLLNFFGFKG